MSEVFFKKKAKCVSCDKWIEDEFIESHRSLGHLVDFFVFGGYKRSENESGNEPEKGPKTTP